MAYDLAHKTWLISSLAARTTFDSVTGSTVVLVSRSRDGLTWSNPVIAATSSSSQNFDKDWIVCDQHPASKFFGRCYEQWDDGASSPPHVSFTAHDYFCLELVVLIAEPVEPWEAAESSSRSFHW